MSNQTGAPSQRVVFFPKAHEELFKGATVLANAVASTMGPIWAFSYHRYGNWSSPYNKGRSNGSQIY